MDQFFLDTNVVIRFLTKDHEAQSPLAYKLFERAANGELGLYLSPFIVAECCCVLGSTRYGYDKQEISKQLRTMIQAKGIKTEEKESVLKALKDYEEQNVDFIDALLAAHVGKTAVKAVVTWNRKHFKRLDIEFYTPEEILSVE